MTAYPHAHALREGANTSARPSMFRGVRYALLAELVTALAIMAWRLAL